MTDSESRAGSDKRDVTGVFTAQSQESQSPSALDETKLISGSKGNAARRV